jgi:hypothetical protein
MSKFYERSKRERADVEAPAVEYAKARGWWHTKVTSPTRRGLPDDLFVRRGVYLWIEFKAPGEEPSEQQKMRHRSMIENGMDVRWTSSLAQAKDWLK